MSGRILVLDDDPEVVRLVSTVLEKAGYVVAGTTDPRQALELAREPVCLVLTDLMLPHMDGESFLQSLKSTLGERTPPIVLVSASLAAAEIARRSGAAAIVAKPFDLEHIRDLAFRFCGPPPNAPNAPAPD